VDEIHAKYQQIRSLPDNKSDNFSRVKNLVQWYEGQGSTSPGKILDVGCGLAVFTKSMQELGWNVSAIDLDKSFVTHAKQLGLNAKLTLLKDYPGDAFDLLTFNKVLEHVRYPDNLLHEGIRLLKGRGLIYLEVPDASASSMGKEREEFLSGHIHVFSIESISRLIRLLNLDLLKIKSVIEPSGKMTIRVLCGLTRKHL